MSKSNSRRAFAAGKSANKAIDSTVTDRGRQRERARTDRQWRSLSLERPQDRGRRAKTRKFACNTAVSTTDDAVRQLNVFFSANRECVLVILHFLHLHMSAWFSQLNWVSNTFNCANKMWNMLSNWFRPVLLTAHVHFDCSIAIRIQ